MLFHRNAKLGLAGRLALVRAIEEGLSLKAAAAAFSVSPATAHRWWHRWLEASEEARRTLACLCDRSSRPHRFPRELAPERICACRHQTGWGPRWLPLSPALRTRPSGRCCTGRGSRARHERRESRPTATSGLVQAICCTWTSPATPASSAPARPHRRPLAALTPLDARGNKGRLRLRARNRRRLFTARLGRAPRRRARPDGHRLRHTSARLLRRARHRREADADR